MSGNKLPKKVSTHRSTQELLKEIAELTRANERLKALVTDILNMLEKKV